MEWIEIKSINYVIKIIISILFIYVSNCNNSYAQSYVYYDESIFTYTGIDGMNGLPGTAYNGIVPNNYTYYRDSIISYVPFPGSKDLTNYCLLKISTKNDEKIFLIAMDSDNKVNIDKKALLAIKKNGGKWKSIEKPKWQDDDIKHEIEDALISVRIVYDGLNLANQKRAILLKQPINIDNVLLSMDRGVYPKLTFIDDVSIYKWVNGRLVE